MKKGGSGIIGWVAIVWIGLLPGTISAQAGSVYPVETYLEQVRTQYPLFLRAELQTARATAQQQIARGAFDPKLYGTFDQKEFKGKNYYRIGEAGVKVPTLPGIDVKAAYTWSDGVFLNPEATLPEAGQLVAGVELRLGRGLLFDDRRAALRQADLLTDLTLAERDLLRNEIILAAATAYWNWAFAYEQVRIYEQAAELTRRRLVLVRESFLQGDKPAIDTLETTIQLRNREAAYLSAQQELVTARLSLSTFLWAGETPLVLHPDQQPMPLEGTVERVELILENLVNHPKLRQFDLKRQQIALKERLYREDLKPDIRASYNLLSDGTDFTPGSDGDGGFDQLLTANYKWGVAIEYPLLQRKARGNLELLRLDDLENDYNLRTTELDLRNKVLAYLQALDLLREQLLLQQEAQRGYELLLEAEREKFRIGESSIFLLNSREQKLIEAQLKVQKLRAELQKTGYKLRYAAGILQ